MRCKGLKEAVFGGPCTILRVWPEGSVLKGPKYISVLLFLSPECYSSPSKAEGDSSKQSYSMGDGSRSIEIPQDCDNIFYKCVTEVNHLCVKEQVTDIIASILE
jgi:hypothetical protein